jgi:peroxiredoxin
MNSWIKLALLVVATVVVTQFLVRRPAPKLTRGRAAPPLALRDLGGREVDLASMRGKVVVVNFWATWCAPCQLEMPELAELWTDNRHRCVDVLGVAEESDVEDVRRVASALPYTIVVDERATALRSWGVGGYPHTFVVDALGNVRLAFQGALRRRQLEEAILPLLPPSCPST